MTIVFILLLLLLIWAVASAGGVRKVTPAPRRQNSPRGRGNRNSADLSSDPFWNAGAIASRRAQAEEDEGRFRSSGDGHGDEGGAGDGAEDRFQGGGGDFGGGGASGGWGDDGGGGSTD
jgi:uncharacterized membrane protein YgcG